MAPMKQTKQQMNALRQEARAAAEARFLGETLFSRNEQPSAAQERQFKLAKPKRMSVRVLLPLHEDETLRVSVLGFAFGKPVPLGIYALTHSGKFVLAGRDWRSWGDQLRIALGIGQVLTPGTQVEMALTENLDQIVNAHHDPADRAEHRLETRQIEEVRLGPLASETLCKLRKKSAEENEAAPLPDHLEMESNDMNRYDFVGAMGDTVRLD